MIMNKVTERYVHEFINFDVLMKVGECSLAEVIDILLNDMHLNGYGFYHQLKYRWDCARMLPELSQRKKEFAILDEVNAILEEKGMPTYECRSILDYKTKEKELQKQIKEYLNPQVLLDIN